MNFEILAAFTLATAGLALSPGPDNLFVLSLSISNGKKAGLVSTAGLVAGCLVHISLLAFGVSAIINESKYLFFTIKLFGALYLFYLAYRISQSPSTLTFEDGKSLKSTPVTLFRQGFIMNVLNPKVAIFFLAFFPGFLFSKDVSSLVQFFVLGFIFMGVTAIVFSLIAILSGSISVYLRSAGITKALKWFQVLVFAGIGVYLLISDK